MTDTDYVHTTTKNILLKHDYAMTLLLCENSYTNFYDVFLHEQDIDY